MKKIIKMVYGMGVLGMTSIPLALSVSCGGGSEYSNVILIKSTFASGGPQFAATKAVIEKYNAFVEEHNKANPSDIRMKAQLMRIEGGYGTIAPLEARDIQNKAMGTVSNLFIDYPDSIGILSRYNAQLDLSALAKNPVSRDKFDARFTEINDKIEGVTGEEAAKKTLLYAAPLGLSTDMIVGNLPVLKKILQDVLAASGQVKGLKLEGAEIKEDAASQEVLPGLLKNVVEFVKTGDKFDDAEVAKKWGAVSNPAKLATLDINEMTFKNYDEIAKFSADIQEAYGKNGRSDEYVLGIDAPTNAIYQSIFAKAGFSTKAGEFAYGINDQGKADYNAILNEDGTLGASKNIIDALKVFDSGVKTGGLRFQVGGAYTSKDMVEHRAAISWGSTAGYNYNFKGEKGGSYYQFDNDLKIDYVKILVDKSLKPNAPAEAIAVTNDRYKNPIYKESDKPATLGKYDITVSDAAAKIIEDNIKGFEKKAFLSSTPALANKIGKVTKAYENSSGYQYYAINDSSLVKQIVATNGDAKTVQLSEAGFVPAPMYFGATTDTVSNMVQGPSFIPIKHGDNQDEQVGLFLNWFYNENSKIKDGAKEVSIVEYFNDKAQYITPLKGKFDSGQNQPTAGNGIVFETFKTIPALEQKAFQAPVTSYSSVLRKSVFDAALSNFWTNSANINAELQSEIATPEDVYKKMKQIAAPEILVS